jgi:hypothetical protein
LLITINFIDNASRVFAVLYNSDASRFRLGGTLDGRKCFEAWNCLPTAAGIAAVARRRTGGAKSWQKRATRGSSFFGCFCPPGQGDYKRKARSRPNEAEYIFTLSEI